MSADKKPATADLGDGGLPKFAASLRKILPDLEICPGQVFGRVGSAGVETPTPSSAARLCIGGAHWWAPWPIVCTLPSSSSKDASIVAPLFLWGGQVQVFPTMRVLISKQGDKEQHFEFFSLDEWLKSALFDWALPLSMTGKQSSQSAAAIAKAAEYYKSDGLPTVARQLKLPRDESEPKEEILKIVGNVIRYALHGRDKKKKKDNQLAGIKGAGVILPDRAPFLRPLTGGGNGLFGGFPSSQWADSVERSENAFQIRCEQSILLSSQVFWPDVDRSAPLEPLALRLQKGHEGVPHRKKNKELRFVPNCEDSSRGIDPYHTSEDSKIRLHLHVALGAQIAQDRKALLAPSNRFSLSPATSQIPFAGYNDPRRLLLGAKAQVNAVPLCEPEAPLITTDQRSALNLDPPGVNLRVGYIAWAGWNHEDAWVVSKSAAKKLESKSVITRDIPISALESEPVIVPADPRNSIAIPLVERRVSPAFLWPHFDKLSAVLNKLGGKHFAELLTSGTCMLRESPDDSLQIKGEPNVKDAKVEILRRLANKDNASCAPEPAHMCGRVEISDKVRQRYREVRRTTVEVTRSLQPGDKLATRHGHKGVVGLILPDARMPQWNGEPLEAMIDPISVLNRGNWGQLYETLAGAVVDRQGGGTRVDSEYTAADWLCKFCGTYPGSDYKGRSIVSAPADSQWFADSGAGREFRAIAGRQFVMRMPQNASEKISDREIKVDLRTQFALWAHEQSQPAMAATNSPAVAASQLSEAADKLRQLLWLAGVELVFEKNGASGLTVRRLRLDDMEAIPHYAQEFVPDPGVTGRSTAKQLSQLEEDVLYYAKFPQPTATAAAIPPGLGKLNNEQSQEPRDERHSGSRNLPWKEIRWLPIVSLKTIESITSGRYGVSGQPAKFRSALSRALVALCKAVVDAAPNGGKTTKADAAQTSSADDHGRRVAKNAVREALSTTVREALRAAVGTSSAGEKKAFMRREVQEHSVPKSIRAVIAPMGLPSEGSDPGGAMHFPRLNEVHLPETAAKTLFGSYGDSQVVWIKRDPVLDRWGVLAVKFSTHSDRATIRVPASLLGALGDADYDGDDSAVFVVEPGMDEVANRSQPSRILVDKFSEDAHFVPGKQYIYGLHLLFNDERNAGLLATFHATLQDGRAPKWPPATEEGDLRSQLKGQLNCWNAEASENDRDDLWWGMLEIYALRALALNPGMDLGVFTKASDIRDLEAAKCGAAKADLYPEDNPNDRQSVLMDAILRGESLDLLDPSLGASGQPAPVDPIREIMVPAPRQKQLFGNEIRHLIFKARVVTPRMIMAVQALTRQMTQAVLSVKSVGKPLPNFSEYKRALRHRWIGEPVAPSDENEVLSKRFNEKVAKDVVSEIEKAFAREAGLGMEAASGTAVQENPNQSCHHEPLPWQRWFFAPSELLALLHPEDTKNGPADIQFVEFKIPLDDLRVRPWIG